jgi:hypothetical protein
MSRKLGFDFQRRRRKGREEDQKLGLVVGPKAIIVYRDVVTVVDGRKRIQQELVWDGLADAEYKFRMGGGQKVIFEEADGDDDINEYGNLLF